MDSLSDLLACIDQAWSPQIGDPSVMGWLTVALYGAAALASIGAGVRRPQDRRFWIALAVLLLALGINKQFDLQSAMTAVGRCAAQLQGWYEDRRVVQVAFIVGLLAVSALVLIVVLIRMRRSLGRVGLAMAGFAFLVTFVAVRAIGFHHFDQLINAGSDLGIRANWVLELTGIVLILINAVTAMLRPAPDPRETEVPYRPDPVPPAIKEPEMPYTRFPKRR